MIYATDIVDHAMDTIALVHLLGATFEDELGYMVLDSVLSYLSGGRALSVDVYHGTVDALFLELGNDYGDQPDPLNVPLITK